MFPWGINDILVSWLSNILLHWGFLGGGTVVHFHPFPHILSYRRSELKGCHDCVISQGKRNSPLHDFLTSWTLFSPQYAWHDGALGLDTDILREVTGRVVLYTVLIEKQATYKKKRKTTLYLMPWTSNFTVVSGSVLNSAFYNNLVYYISWGSWTLLVSGTGMRSKREY